MFPMTPQHIFSETITLPSTFRALFRRKIRSVSFATIKRRLSFAGFGINRRNSLASSVGHRVMRAVNLLPGTPARRLDLIRFQLCGTATITI